MRLPARGTLQGPHLSRDWAEVLRTALRPVLQGAALIDPHRLAVGSPENVVHPQADHVPVGQQGVGHEAFGQGLVRLLPAGRVARDQRIGQGDVLLVGLAFFPFVFVFNVPALATRMPRSRRSRSPTARSPPILLAFVGLDQPAVALLVFAPSGRRSSRQRTSRRSASRPSSPGFRSPARAVFRPSRDGPLWL